MTHKSIIICGALLLGLGSSSCSKNEPTEEGKPQREIESNNDQTTEMVSVELEMTEEEANSARSLNYTLTDSYSTDNMKLSASQQDEMQALLVMRNGKEPYATVYREGTWRRQVRNGKTIWTFRADVPLLKNKETDRNLWYAMVLVGENTKEPREGLPRFIVKNHVKSIVDLSQGKEVSLNIPYASTWRHMKWNANTNSYQTIGANKLKLFPLGIVMTYRVTNNMAQDSKVGGIKIMTNHLEATGSYSLTSQDLPPLPTTTDIPATESTPQLKWTSSGDSLTTSGVGLYENDGGAGFYRYRYDLPMDMIPSGKTSNVVAVAWYQPNDKPTRVDFTDANSMLGAYALAHVYALKPENKSGEIPKPNYNVVPIMGSDVHLTSGKKYEMPCELYEQPNMQLGYFAQTMVKHAGDAKTAPVITAQKSLMTSAEQYDPRYVAYLNNSTASTALASIGGDLSVPLKTDVVWGLGFVVGGNINFTDPNTGSKTTRRARSPQSSSDLIRSWAEPVATINGSGGRDAARDFLALNSNGGVEGESSDVQNVSILYRANKVGIRASDRKADKLLNLYQSAYRLTKVPFATGGFERLLQEQTTALGATPWMDDPFSLSGGVNVSKYAFEYLKIESVYLGKYYVGDVEAVRNSEKLFDNSAHNKNKVERHLLVTGELMNMNLNNNASWLKDIKHVGLHVVPLYQGVPNSLSSYSKAEHEKYYLGVRFNSSLYIVSGTSFPTCVTHRPVLPISTRYQGDSAQ